LQSRPSEQRSQRERLSSTPVFPHPAGSWRVPAPRQSAVARDSYGRRPPRPPPGGPASGPRIPAHPPPRHLPAALREARAVLHGRFAAPARSLSPIRTAQPRLGPWRRAGDPGPGLHGSPDPFGVVRGRPVESEKARAFSSSPSRPRSGPGSPAISRQF
jgi:hypothetical protein